MAFYPAVPTVSTAGGTITGPLAINGSFPAGAELVVTNTASGPTTPSSQFIAASNADLLLAGQVTADTFFRYELFGGGAQKFGPGNGAVDCTIQRIGAGVFGVSVGSFDVSTAGQGLRVAEGANAKQGTFALSGAATTVVANTSVTANSRILMTCQALGTVTAASTLCVSARTAGTSFTVTPSQATDTSTIAYEIFEPG